MDVAGGWWKVEVDAKCSTNTRECDVKIMRQSSAAEDEAGERRGQQERLQIPWDKQKRMPNDLSHSSSAASDKKN